ncbi:MAG: hypothetical protein OK455_02530 [Thaumarchaeota archaeon]|nr:hypothetical protein [Nitrososphaerota archaeon]
MIWDVDDLLNELRDVIATTLRQLEQGKVVTTTRVVGDDLFKITTRVSVGPAVPEAVRPSPPPQAPLLDVFDDGKRLRVVVELPGVKKEDVQVHFMNDALRIDVSKGGVHHQADIPCMVVPGSIKVLSTRENNSVVEITFLRKAKATTSDK